MNKNQIQGEVKNIAGKVQEQVGKLLGSKEQQAHGIQKQVAGTAEVMLGDAKQAVEVIVAKVK